MTDFSGGNLPDIAGNIKAIEKLKSGLLTDIAQVFAIMADNKQDTEELNEKLAEIIIQAYILSRRLGTEFSDMDHLAINKLKLLMAGQNDMNPEYAELSRRFKDGKKAL